MHPGILMGDALRPESGWTGDLLIAGREDTENHSAADIRVKKVQGTGSGNHHRSRKTPFPMS